MIKAIDLFAGCGGLSIGFIQSGYEISKAVEFDPSIAATYKNNHPDTKIIIDDIKNIDMCGEFSEGEANVIIGGPPCQGFSMAGSRIRNGFIDDPRNYLFKHYFNVVKSVKPQVFIMENVKGITTMQKGKIFKEIKRIFSDKELLGGFSYDIYHRLVRGVDFGIPQKRERIIIVGVLNRNVDFIKIWEDTNEMIKYNYPYYFDKVTVYDAISNMPSPTEDGVIINPEPKTEYQRFLGSNSKTIANHLKTNHSKIALERMKKISCGENYTVLNETINSVHSGSYGRLCWDEPAHTITTRFDTPAGGRFIHPEQNRTLTPREAARIQSFPDDFIFYGNKTSISKQIGNAVPPKISYFLAEYVKNILKEIGFNE